MLDVSVYSGNCTRISSMISANPMLHGSHPNLFFLPRLALTTVKGLCKTFKKCGPQTRLCGKRYCSISFTGVCSVLSLYTTVFFKFMLLGDLE